MATKTFVAKNGLTANTANVFFSQLATNLTPTAGGLILFADSTGKIGSRTEAQIKSDIGAGVVETVTAGNGITGGGTGATVTVTLATPSTLTVGGTNTVGGTAHQHAITSSTDTSGGGAVILACDSDGDLKVRDFDTSGDLIVGDDATLKSDSAVLGWGAGTDVTLTHTNDVGITLNSTRKLMFNDATQFVQGLSATVLGLGATDEIDLTATAVDINATVDMSSSVVVGTTLTVGTSLLADAQDGAAIGSGTAQFSDLYLADGAQVLFGDDSEITLTHVADKGLTLKHAAAGDDKFPTLTLATGDTDIAVNDVLGSIEFVAPDEGAGTDSIKVAGAVRVISEGDFSTSSNASKMSFMLGSSDVATEKMALSSGGNLTISGDLIVSGTTTTISSTTINVVDPLIALATNNNAADAVDIGFYGLYDTSGSQDLYAGLFRDAGDGKWRLFKDNQAAPTTTVNISGTGYAVATLVANLEGDVTGDITGDITGDVTGNADTATALATTRAIGGVNFDGSAAITPQNITVADESSDTSCFVLFGTAATGAVQPKTGTNLTFNSSTGLLTATGISGNLTGTLQTAAQTNVTSVSALDGGSITSGFGTIDTGASAISTTGVVTGGSVVITNESTIGSAGDTNAVIVGASGTIALTPSTTLAGSAGRTVNRAILYGASNSSVGVATTQAFSGTIGTSATEAVFTFKAADGTASPTGATNFMGGEIVMSLKSGSNYETKKIMIHHDSDPSADGSDVFFTEYATLGTEIGETLATAMGDADGTGLTTDQDKHVQFKITNPSGTDTLQYSGVAHLVEVPGDA